MSFWRMPLDAEEQGVTVGEVHIIAYRCKGCRYCIEFCPNNVLAESEEFNEKGYHPPYAAKDGKCVNCNFCETICPEFAIFVTEGKPGNLQPADVLHDVKPGRRLQRKRRYGE